MNFGCFLEENTRQRQRNKMEERKGGDRNQKIYKCFFHIYAIAHALSLFLIFYTYPHQRIVIGRTKHFGNKNTTFL